MYKLQIHFGKQPSPKSILPIKNSNESVNKPIGGFWTSTYTPGRYLCAWQDWCLNSEYSLYGTPWLLVVKDSARIITPRTANKFIINAEHGERYDWEKMSANFDGFHYNEHFVFVKESLLWNLTYDFDAESTVWFNWQFEDVMPFSKEAVEKILSEKTRNVL